MKKTLTVALALALALPAASPASEVVPGNGPRSETSATPPTPSRGRASSAGPAFVEIDGQLREEWEYESGDVLNARTGDAVLSPGCGLIANLLKKVDETARYSHAGIMVEDRFKIRHSTAIPERMFDKGAGDPPGTEGVVEEALKYGWPGTITQWADEAFEGSILEDPVGGKGYLMTAFNSTPLQCESSGELVPSTVLRPPPTVDADPATRARDRLLYAAAAAEQIEGHYPFSGYTDPASVLSTPVNLPGHWADGTVGSVCSGLVWRAMRTSTSRSRAARSSRRTWPAGGSSTRRRRTASTCTRSRSGRSPPSSSTTPSTTSPRRRPGAGTSSWTRPTTPATRSSTASGSTGAARRSRRRRPRTAATRTTTGPRTPRAGATRAPASAAPSPPTTCCRGTRHPRARTDTARTCSTGPAATTASTAGAPMRGRRRSMGR